MKEHIPIAIQSDINHCPQNPVVVIDGEPRLSIGDTLAVATRWVEVKLELTPEVAERTRLTLGAIDSQVAEGVPIYGVSSSFGAQAGHVLNQGDAESLHDNARKLSSAIAHVDVSTGDPLPIPLVRAAMLIRLNSLSRGYSGIRPATLSLIVALLNAGVTPLVGRYGSLGASGDLAQNGRLVSVLQQRASTRVFTRTGEVRPAEQVLTELQLRPLELAPKEGLALVNGDNYSSAAAVCAYAELSQRMALQLSISALAVQVLLGSSRNYHPLLETLRPHPGQIEVATALRRLLAGSHLALQETVEGHQPKARGVNIQDAYSIRCLPQFLGPDIEMLHRVRATIDVNINAVSDNPLWPDENTTQEGEQPFQWVSGGNFLAMHMAESIDSMRKTLVRLVKLNDRHLARLVNPSLSNGLPPNLSGNATISRCAFKGVQSQMGMLETYASVMASPVTTAFGVHEELNQDITAHALSSYLIALELIKVLRLSQASILLAICQAVDLRGGPKLLSQATQPLYEWVRSRSAFVDAERPLGPDIELIASGLDGVPFDFLELSEHERNSGVYKA